MPKGKGANSQQSVPVEIEPLTAQERKEKYGSSKAPPPVAQEEEPIYARVSDHPDYPKDWRNKPVEQLVASDYKYYKKALKDGKVYMILRKGRHDKGLGRWSEEKERKLFRFFPSLSPFGDVGRTKDMPSRAGVKHSRGFLSIPIRRVAVVPRDYIPTIDVIRYFQIMKNNGFPGDFSKFINDIIIEHFVSCHGIVLPVMLRDEYNEEEED